MLAPVLPTLLPLFRALLLDDCLPRGDRGGVRIDLRESMGEGGTNGKAERRESAMLDAALRTDALDDFTTFKLSIACRCCCSSTPDGGTPRRGRLVDEGIAGSIKECAVVSGALIGERGRSRGGGTRRVWGVMLVFGRR